jgi:hypothetical protein
MTPAERLGDGLAPDCFYTYQIIFVPDLTQKYGLRVTGGAGEIRAAMNLVNGHHPRQARLWALGTDFLRRV